MNNKFANSLYKYVEYNMAQWRGPSLSRSKEFVINGDFPDVILTTAESFLLFFLPSLPTAEFIK